MSADTTGVKVESSTTENVATPSQGGGGGGGGGDRDRDRDRERDRDHDRDVNGERPHFGGNQHFGNPRRGRGHDGGPRFGNRRPNQQNAQFEDKKPRFQRGPNQQQGGSGEFGRGNILERIMYEKLNEMAGPTYDLAVFENKEKKFSGRSRLYIGNIPSDIDENELTDMFKQYGETSEFFINKEKNFGFIRIDYHFNAEKAKNELNGKVINGRTLKIRFAPNSSAIKIKNLDDFVTNELLHAAFSIFGEIDRSVVIVDERGKSVGEGVVEFARKNSAQFAIRKCTENCFFLTSNLRPVFVEPYETLDEMDGYSEKFLPRKNPDFFKFRNIGPRFAPPDSFEEEYGLRWKQLNELYTQKMQAAKKENDIEQEKLVAQMEFARYEHETAMLREQLRAREMDMDRHKREWEHKEQQAEEARRRTEEQMRRQQQDLQTRMTQQEEEMRKRQQENTLFRQAQQLDTMLENQEQAYDQHDSNSPNAGGSGNMDPKTFLTTYERNRFGEHELTGQTQMRGGQTPMRGGQTQMRGGHMGDRGHWGNDNRDFPNKRRRY